MGGFRGKLFVRQKLVNYSKLPSGIIAEVLQRVFSANEHVKLLHAFMEHDGFPPSYKLETDASRFFTFAPTYWEQASRKKMKRRKVWRRSRRVWRRRRRECRRWRRNMNTRTSNTRSPADL
jgi:hypothetical protein